MSLSDLASLGSFVSGVAVLVSLIYLALQVRQAKRNQQASIRQGRAGHSLAIAMGSADSALADALYRALTGAQDITATEVWRFSRYCHAIFGNLEDAFYQNQDGLLIDSAFVAVVNSTRAALSRPAFRVQWRQARTRHGAEFAEFVDRLIVQTPVEPFSTDPTEWLSAFAAEMSGARN